MSVSPLHAVPESAALINMLVEELSEWVAAMPDAVSMSSPDGEDLLAGARREDVEGHIWALLSLQVVAAQLWERSGEAASCAELALAHRRVT